jgi:glycosyltransferase involved in cell wall biosynthesis
MFLESARIFLDHNPDIPARFLIIGDGELRDDLINYCQQHGLSDYVKFCGWKRDLPKAYADLDILALTSINEGTPVSIIEAMASCVPVISTEAGGVRDLLGTPIPVISQNGFQIFERGILCRQDDAEGFANGLKYIIQNGRIRQEISDSARSFVTRVHSQERLLQDVESVYLELLKHDRDKVSSGGNALSPLQHD